ncbi:MAG: alpha/beta hydrolase [Chloroflexi bacterium]|nr:alpha/beta hydrolase [Chloroflexota bacterium]MDA1271081.1 alpha/beta hydrolase [Chloroflexota bacterium]PKB58587.1 MAG: hypothetical protein BZY83_06325 [SAR202 cluster bacterium Casp-Chloro-G2]
MKLVFLHGAGSSSLAYYYQLRHFRNSKAIDLPGHSTGKACNDIGSYVEWVRGFITARRYKDVVLCGHSMGGAIALQYALRYPEELKGLILLGTGARLRVHPDYLERCRQPGPDNSQWLAGVMKSYKKVAPDMQPVLSQRAVEVGPEVELNDLLACDQFDVMGQLENIDLPVQVLCGSDDVMTPVKYADYLTAHLPNARETVINGGTHYFQMEKYKKVNEEIEQFMASLK